MLAERAARRCTIAVVVVVLATTGGGLALLAAVGPPGLRAVTPSELALTIGLTGFADPVAPAVEPDRGAAGADRGAVRGDRARRGRARVRERARGVPGALRQPALAWAWLTPALALPWALFLLWFPDGRFIGRGWKRFFVAAAVASLALAVAGYLLSAPGGRLPALSPVGAGPGKPPVARSPAAGRRRSSTSSTCSRSRCRSWRWPVSLQRYRRSGAIVRQQIKWLVAGAAVAVAGSAIASLDPEFGRRGSRRRRRDR